MNQSNCFLRAAAAIAVAGTLSAVLDGLSLLRYRQGASIRPMGEALLIAVITVGTFLGALGCAALGWRGHPRWLWWLAVLLAFAPFPMFHLAVTIAQGIRGLTFEP
jgi:hypothetical protein